jgi:hypothetical protein
MLGGFCLGKASEDLDAKDALLTHFSSAVVSCRECRARLNKEQRAAASCRKNGLLGVKFCHRVKQISHPMGFFECLLRRTSV